MVMKIIINKLTGQVEIDEVAHTVDLSTISPVIRNIVYSTDNKSGTINYTDDSQVGIGAAKFSSFGQYVSAWHAIQNPVVLSPAEIRQVQIDEINRQRELALSSGFIWNGKRWHTDTIFQAQITAYVSAYGTGLLAPAATVQIRGMDNSNNVLSRTELFALAGALMTFVGTTFAASWGAKDAL
jgi:hypothetical protein